MSNPETHENNDPFKSLERQRDLEQALGGRVLAWAGGIAVLLGIAFLLGIAIDHGVIDASMRLILAFLGSTALLLAGVWLYERKGQTLAALATVACALPGLYATLFVGTQIYELIPVGIGLACAGLVGAVGVAIAVRWDSTIVAAVGILGALSAPVLVSSDVAGSSIAFLAIALIAAIGVLLWRRWDWLSLGAFVVSAPQLLIWFAQNYDERTAVALSVLAGFWVLYLVAAIGYQLRAREPDALPVASWLVLLGSVGITVGAGYFALADTGQENAATAWLLGLAAANILLGAVALRQPISREIGSLLVACGLGLAGFGFADAVDGPVLVIGWVLVAVVLTYLASRANRESGAVLGSDAERLLLAAGGFLGLAIGHTLLYEAPPTAIASGVANPGEAIGALAACAAAAFYGRVALRDFDPWIGQALEAICGVALVYLGSVTIVDTLGVTASGESRQIGQALLSVFWGLSGLGAVIYGLLRDVRRLRLAGLALLGLTIGKVYTYDLAELEELSRVLSFIALGLLLLIGAFAYQRIRVGVSGEIEEAAQ